MTRRGVMLWLAACIQTRAAAADEPAAVLAALDAQVLETVLKDLLSHADSPLEPRNAPGRKVHLSPDLLQGKSPLERALRRQNPHAWDQLTPAQLKLIEEAGSNLSRRAAARERLQKLQLKTAGLVLYSQEEEALDAKIVERRLRRPQVFRAYPPGYSADRRTALVHLEYPWSGGFHSGDATWILKKEQTGWSILLRQFVYYV